MEAIRRKEGKFHSRVEVGKGFLTEATNGDIVVDFGPSLKSLIVKLSALSEEKVQVRKLVA